VALTNTTSLSDMTDMTNASNADTREDRRIMATSLSTVRPGAPGAAGDGDVTPEKKKKSKKKLIIVLVLVLVLGGAGYVLKGRGGAKGPAKPQPGPVLALDSVNLNLADGHYLKLDIALQTTKKAPSDIDGSQALDLAVSQFSGMGMDQLAVPAKREAAKKALLTAIEKAYPDEVMDIYFTEFVMQ
jgi:flagellar FliL protein